MRGGVTGKKKERLGIRRSVRRDVWREKRMSEQSQSHLKSEAGTSNQRLEPQIRGWNFDLRKTSCLEELGWLVV